MTPAAVQLRIETQQRNERFFVVVRDIRKTKTGYRAVVEVRVTRRPVILNFARHLRKRGFDLISDHMRYSWSGEHIWTFTEGKS